MKGGRRGGLGRGLGALIPSMASRTVEEPEDVAAEVAVDEPEVTPKGSTKRTRKTTPKQPTRGHTEGGVARRGKRAAVVEVKEESEELAEEPEELEELEEDSDSDSDQEVTEEATKSYDDSLTPVPGARFGELPIDSIVPNPKQPRHVFDEEALDELQTSIREVGLLQPIVVRPLGDDTYELIMGERRLRSSKAIGLTTIPAIIRDTSDDDMLRDALLENIHRANLNPLEEGAAYQQLLEEFNVTHEELSKRIGRSRPQISNTIRLLNLPPSVQRRVAAGVISAGHARALLSLDDSGAQEALAGRIVAEGLSVRVTEELVALGEVDTGTRAPAVRRPKAHAPALHDLAEKLCDRFDTKVRVDLGRRKGKITIEFATVDDLERIVGVIGFDK